MVRYQVFRFPWGLINLVPYHMGCPLGTFFQLAFWMLLRVRYRLFISSDPFLCVFLYRESIKSPGVLSRPLSPAPPPRASRIHQGAMGPRGITAAREVQGPVVTAWASLTALEGIHWKSLTLYIPAIDHFFFHFRDLVGVKL